MGKLIYPEGIPVPLKKVPESVRLDSLWAEKPLKRGGKKILKHLKKTKKFIVTGENPDESNSIEEDWVLSIFVVVISIPIALLCPFTLTYRLSRGE